MNKVFIPTTTPMDWKQFLADPETQWKSGHSAKAVAYSWQEANGLPEEVREILTSAPCFEGIVSLVTLPEHKVALPGGVTASANDVWLLARTERDLVSIAVEGKVSEPFGETVGEWLKDASEGKQKRLAFIFKALNFKQRPPDNIRYQLLHRSVSALIEARRFHAKHAVMLVHSFSQTDEWFEDYAAFLNLFNLTAETNEVVTAGVKSGIQLHFAWVRGNQRYLTV